MKDYLIANDRFSFKGNGFLLENGTFSWFEPIGVTWNDSFCRRIVNHGQPGCFVERDIDLHQINYLFENDHNFGHLSLMSIINSHYEKTCEGRSLKTSFKKIIL